ncbi:hypothetical protein ASC94_26685 [Massilia sp. Root418]|jgi:hypothetical protein|uniref:hypothetical protein n=1 Tax=Massilia sp. Root418 TaxID=1736532 RepID=UPI0006F64CE2|nr:hypothetical protein [Massilia sp. Root418]KQW87020.1 hypothetical protein ASC94_26685 [Massilia sp. Root418]
MKDCTSEACIQGKYRSLWSELAEYAGTLLRKLLHTPEQHYAWDYFMLVKTERDGLDPATLTGSPAQLRCDELIRNLCGKYCRIRYKLSIQEVWQVDLALVQMLPGLALRAKAASVYAAYRKLAGETGGSAPEAAAVPAAVSAAGPALAEDCLRAEVTDLMRGKFWHQLNAMLLERGFRALKRVLLDYATRGLVLSAALAALLQLLPGRLGDALTVGMLCLYFGVLGAVISVARRTRNFNDIATSDSDPVIRLMRIENGKTGIHLSVITGGVFAVILYLGLVAGIPGDSLKTSLLPLFPHTANAIAAGDMVPLDAASLAKLLLLAFMAGFAEQLVPDVLDRFTALAQGTGKRHA